MTDAIVAGTYNMKPVEWEVGETSKGGDQVAFSFEFVDGPYAGQRLAWYGFFSEAALPYTIKSLVAMGWDRNPASFETCKSVVPCQVTIESYTNAEGKTVQQTRVARVGAGLAMAKKFDDAEKKAFSSRLASLIGAPAPNAGASKEFFK